MDWTFSWSINCGGAGGGSWMSRHHFIFYTILLMMVLFIPVIKTNNACDWTGSGLSTPRQNRDIVSIYLQCSAGKVIWKYPRGAIQILLRPAISGMDKGFRVCLKIHHTDSSQSIHFSNDVETNDANDLISNQQNDHNTPVNDEQRQHYHPRNRRQHHQHRHRYGRIYLGATKRLIPLYTNNDDQLVRCFYSVRDQATLYVEAEEMPYEKNARIAFEYNLEFVNNKPYSTMRSHNSHNAANDIKHKKLLSQRNTELRSTVSAASAASAATTTTSSVTNDIVVNIELETAASAGSLSKIASTIWNRLWNRQKRSISSNENEKTLYFMSDNDDANKFERTNIVNGYAGVAHQHRTEILNELGDSWESCRPCDDIEMVHTYCSSDIVIRGNIFNIQERQDLDTNEIIIAKTKVLRDNKYVPIDDYTPNDNQHQEREQQPQQLPTHLNYKINVKPKISFHTHRHCPVSPGEGEFVFMGRLRFKEIMLACAPRLEEWAGIVYKFNRTNDAPCILAS